MASNLFIPADHLAESHASTAAVEEAQAVVEDIAALNGVFTPALLAWGEGPNCDKDIKRLVASNTNLKKIASEATHKLAGDLYDVPTRFVLESIQNADDNDYEAGIKPFLRLSVAPKQIRLDCNEKGFKEDHVRAICSVGQSTKSKQKATEGKIGFIGEKGIGFKSVFKLAERVYIHSPPFSFMFDKRRELGMITPSWVPEGEVRSLLRAADSQTAIFLLPNAGETYDEPELLNEFLSIHSTLLLFLRKLKMLELVFTDLSLGSGLSSLHKTLACEMLDSRRAAILTERDVITSKILKREKYYLFEQVREITLAVEEERRKGVKRTELALAFPMDIYGQPCNSPQPVHAFLPIRDYGFTFLIQADFIVTASRQDMELTKPWNEALWGYVSHVFKDAIVDFVKSPNHELRYTWMRFLPTGVSHLLRNQIKNSIQQVMRSSKVLESRLGALHCPPDLYRVLDQIKDRFGCPIVGADSSYLSSNYENRDQALLEDLGVEFCSWPWILEQLYLLGDAVISKPVYWHEDLAKSLRLDSISKSAAWTDWGRHIKNLRLIPLQDGTWVSATEITSNPIYFRQDNGMIDVPADINLRLVESSSSTNTHREQFFRLLGVKDCDKKEVAGLILQKHNDGNPIPPMDDAVAHVKYLFALNPTIRDKLDLKILWLYDEEGNPARSHDLYVRHTALQRYSAASLFGSEFPAKFLSASYSSCTEVNNEPIVHPLLQSWLERSTPITDIPRLTKSGRISQDFEFILKRFPNDVLHILKAHWTTYKSSIGSSQIIRDRLCSYEVQTFDGVDFKQQKLKDTFAPDPILKQISSDLCNESQGVFFLSFDSYKPSDWNFLKVFGVKFIADLSFYDWLIQQTQFRNLCTLPKFKDLLQRMAQLAGVDPSRQLSVWRTFRLNNVFIPKAGGGNWASSRDCVWCAPSGFQKQLSIMQWYNDDDSVRTLLRSTIKIQDATVEAVIEDMTSGTPSGEYLQAASVYIVTKLKNLSNANALKKVREAFKDHAFLPTNGAIPGRLKSTSCFWGMPDHGGPRLSFKHDLQPEYQSNTTMSTLCRSILRLSDPSWDDLMREIEVLKGRNVVGKEHIEGIYAYMFHNFSKKKENWALILAKFENQALVFVKSPSRNCWKRPSECIWQAPVALRCKSALKDQYSSSDLAVLNLIQSILGIKDASVTEYISDLEILSKTSDCSRDDVESLYKSIELQWKPEMEIRSAFGPKPLIFDYKKMMWASLDDCVWSGPDCIKLTTKLAPLYPESRKFFVEYLGVRNALSKTFIHELSHLHIPDPENISAEVLTSVKDILFALNNALIQNPGKKFPETVEKFLKSKRVWPCRYIGLAPVALVDLTQSFFVPDHPLLLQLLHTKEDCGFPVLNVQSEEVNAVKRLLLAMGLEGRSLSLSKKETVSATDTSDPAEDLTEDLRKRAQALFYCAVHYDTTTKLAHDNLLKKLCGIRVYRTPDISTKYEINSQGIEKSVVATGYMRMAEEYDELRVYVPDNESLRKMGYSNSLAMEMIRILQIPEDKSWQVVSALLTSDPDVEQLALILSLHGIHHKLGRQSVSRQIETNETTNKQSDYEDECDVRRNAAIQLPTSSGGSPLSTALNNLSNPSLAVPEEVAHEQPHDQYHINLQSSKNSLPLDTKTFQKLVPSNMSSFGAAHSSPRASQDDIVATRSRIIAKAKAATTSIFTVAPDVRGGTVVAHPTSAFNLSSLAIALPSTPPRTPSKNRSVEDVRSIQSSIPPARVKPTTPPSGTKGLPVAPRTGPHGYGDIGTIGYEGEQFSVEVLKQHLPDFDEGKHWTSRLRIYGGFAQHGTEVTDLTYEDTQGLLSKFIFDRAEDRSVPDWLRAAALTPGSRRPTYFLEVKTTIGACDTPFIISRNQFKIMEDKAVTADGIPTEVYVILRVYDINGQPRIKIYLDPWNSRGRDGGLRFTVENYTVTQISI